MTRITVVIPSRDDAPMLEACLACLAAQSRPADQVIVVDNASTDTTAGVCAAAGVLRIFSAQPGIAPTSAHGFDEAGMAGADILARLDADSRPPADWLARVEAGLSGAGPLSLVTGPGEYYGGHKVVCWLGRTLYLGGYFHVVGFLLGHTPVFGSNFAMTADVWERIGPGVLRGSTLVHDDLDISYRLRPDMHVVFDPLLRMPVSARPFRSWGTLGQRLAKAWDTFRWEFQAEPPLRRRRERRRWDREQGR
ncbi:glycosyltransferase family 2 protein [Arthrobacter livingstonensis]|uniref:glycosyltransferase family 2 protein n=1 Tax=Arthrobacter livingstonensis TaxID=670078 RepID=UPI001FE85BCF|nr:glycosyltransferase family A protein [Arthrobacter livingstonensis]